MAPKGRFECACFLLAFFSASIGFAEKEPEVRPSGIVSEVEVRELQVLITAWPKNGEPEACRDLARDDFQLELDGQPAPILGFIPLEPAFFDQPAVPEKRPVAPAGMRWVILIDEFHHSCPACAARETECHGGVGPPPDQPLHRHDAYQSARRMLQEAFRPGDQVLVASIRFWPMAETGWLTDPAAALETLDRLEQNLTNRVSWDRGAAHTNHWFEGMVSFMNALGQVPGPKDLLFPTCHFPLAASDAEEIRQLSAACARNEVVLHTVDITQCGFSMSYIGPLAIHLGGQRFSSGQGAVGAAVQVRRVAGCRFLISFRPVPGSHPKLGHDFHISCRKPEFDLRGPSNIPDPAQEPDPVEVPRELFLLADFQKRLFLDVSLLPQEPGPGSRRWKGLATVQIRRLPLPDEPALPEKLLLDLVVWQRGGKSVERHHAFTGPALARLLSAEEGHTVAFDLEILSGETQVTAILREEQRKSAFEAVVRRTINLPTVREARRRGLWLPVRRQVRVGQDPLWLPDLNGTFEPRQPPQVLNWSCETGRQTVGKYLGRFRAEGAAPPIEVRVERLLRGPGEEGCRWLVGTPLQPLTPGRWQFEPAGTGKDPVPTAFSIKVRAGE